MESTLTTEAGLAMSPYSQLGGGESRVVERGSL